jgi:mono/diheme cytochrome c family protein
MRPSLFIAAFLIASGTVSATGVWADDVGQREYMTNCATCHGETGKGDGELAPFFNVDMPDLTTLAANNDGVFPMLKIIHTIDGRTGVRGHGSKMPVWGENFKGLVVDDAGPRGAEVIIRGRVLSLAYYLESIQE